MIDSDIQGPCISLSPPLDDLTDICSEEDLLWSLMSSFLGAYVFQELCIWWNLLKSFNERNIHFDLPENVQNLFHLCCVILGSEPVWKRSRWIISRLHKFLSFLVICFARAWGRWVQQTLLTRYKEGNGTLKAKKMMINKKTKIVVQGRKENLCSVFFPKLFMSLSLTLQDSYKVSNVLWEKTIYNAMHKTCIEMHTRMLVKWLYWFYLWKQG